MALKLGELTAVIDADDTQFRKKIDKSERRFEGFGRAATVASTVVVGAAGAASVDLIKMASEAEQSAGAVESVFKESAGQIEQWADQAHESVGLSETDFRNLAAVTGAQLKNMGLPMDEVSGQTRNLIGLGSDLAATFGGPVDQAVGAIGSLLRGEVDPIEQYGVSIKQADIEARLAAEGLDELEGEAAKQARTQALLGLLTEQTADAQGQFAKESDTAAGQAARSEAQWANLRSELGENLLPIATELGTVLSEDVLPFLKDNSDAVMILAGTLVGLAGAVLAINAAVKVWRAMVMIATAVQWAWNIALSANPIGLIIIAIAALVAGIILLWQHSETFRDIVMGVFDALTSAVKLWWEGVKFYFGLLKQGFDLIVAAAKLWWKGVKKYFGFWRGLLMTVVGWVSDVWTSIRDTFGKVIGFVQGLPSRIKSAASGMWDGIKDSFRNAINWLIRQWNNFSLTLGGGSVLGLDVPSVTLSTPNLPLLAEGGTARRAGLAVVGEEGPELLHMRRGATVEPLDRVGGRSDVLPDLDVRVFIGDRELTDIVDVRVSEHDRRLRRRAGAGAGVG